MWVSVFNKNYSLTTIPTTPYVLSCDINSTQNLRDRRTTSFVHSRRLKRLRLGKYRGPYIRRRTALRSRPSRTRYQDLGVPHRPMRVNLALDFGIVPLLHASPVETESYIINLGPTGAFGTGMICKISTPRCKKGI